MSPPLDQPPVPHPGYAPAAESGWGPAPNILVRPDGADRQGLAGRGRGRRSGESP